MSAEFGAAVDFVMNLMLIPKYGSAGAAVGTVIAELSVLSLQVIYILSRREDFRLKEKR